MRISRRFLRRLLPQTTLKRWIYGVVIILGLALAPVTAGLGLLLSLAACLARVVEVLRKPSPAQVANAAIWRNRGYFFDGDGS